MRADFFVHPDFYSLRRGPGQVEVDRYEEDLTLRMAEADLAVLVHEPIEIIRVENEAPRKKLDEGDFWRKFEPSQRYRSQSGRGFLSDRRQALEIASFIDSLDITEAVVHGSYMANCVKQFTRGLELAMKWGNLAYLISEIPRQLIPSDKRELTVALGTVLDFNQTGRSQATPERGKVPDDLVRFMGKETKVFQLH